MALPKRTVTRTVTRPTKSISPVSHPTPPMPPSGPSSWLLTSKAVIAVGTFLIPLAVGTWTPDRWEIHKAIILLATVTIAWLCYFIAQFKQPGVGWRWHPLDWLVILLGFSATVGTLTSANWWTSVSGLQGAYAETLPVTLAFIGFYLLSARLFRAPSERLIIWSAFIGGVGLSLLLQLFQFSEVSLLPGSLGDNPLFSTLANSTSQAGILAAIVATAAMMLWARARERWAQIALVGVVAIAWLVLLFLGSAVAWAIFAAGMILVVLTQGGSTSVPTTKLVLAAVMLAAVGMISQFAKVNTYANLPSTRELSLSQNVSAGTAFSAVASRPVLGTGPNTWYDAFVRYRPLSFNQESTWSSRYLRSGSQWTQILATQGVVGLGLWVGVLAMAAWEFWRELKRGPSFTLLMGFFAALSLALLALLTTWSFTLMMFVWVALGLGRAKLAAREPAVAGTTSAMPAVGFAVAIILLLLIGYPTWRVFASEMQLESAQKNINPVAPLQLVPELDSALRRNGRNSDAAVLLANAHAVGVQYQVQQNNLAEAQKELALATATMRTAVLRDPNNPAMYEAENNLLNSLAPFLPEPEAQANSNAAKLRLLEPSSPIHDVVYGQTLMIKRARLMNGENATVDAARTDDLVRQALAAYAEALRKKPDYPQAQFARAEANTELGQFPAALDDIQALTAAYPTVAPYWTLQGKILGKMKNVEQSKIAFEQSLVIEPQDATTYLEYAEAMIQGESKTEAKTIIERALKVLPNDSRLQDKAKELGDTKI